MNPNRAMLEAVARTIRPLLDRVVFLGGQVTELLITDPASARVRYTTDVDVICRAATRTQYSRIGEELRGLGFTEDTSEGAPVCRWRSAAGVLDIMPLAEEVLGFSNPWYEHAYATARLHEIAPDLRIRVARAPVFLATKWAAFEGRGEGDYLGSRDVEDVVTLVAGRPELLAELAVEPLELRRWVADRTRRFLDSGEAEYALAGALPDARYDPTLIGRVEARLQEIAAGRQG